MGLYSLTTADKALNHLNQGCLSHSLRSLLEQPAKEFLIRCSIILNYCNNSENNYFCLCQRFFALFRKSICTVKVMTFFVLNKICGSNSIYHKT